MGSSRLAFVIVAVATVTAAGTGSYFATRHNAAEVAVVSAAEAPAPGAVASASTSTSTPQPAARPSPLVTPSRPSATEVRPTTSVGAAKPVDARPAPALRRDEATPLEESAPAIAAAPSAPIVPVEEPAPAPSTIETAAAEPSRPADPPSRSFDELIVSADAVIGLQMEAMISSDRARVEDKVEARVSRDVRVGSAVAIPSGTRALGNVVLVERGGRVRERARLGIRFHTLVLRDGTRLDISTDTIYRLGEGPGNGSAAKIGGGAVAGAILGAIINGGKGAAIGAATGAGAGTAAVMTGDRSSAVFPAGSDVTARILSPITVNVERE